jgi:hypothetical protein
MANELNILNEALTEGAITRGMRQAMGNLKDALKDISTLGIRGMGDLSHKFLDSIKASALNASEKLKEYELEIKKEEKRNPELANKLFLDYEHEKYILETAIDEINRIDPDWVKKNKRRLTY